MVARSGLSEDTVRSVSGRIRLLLGLAKRARKATSRDDIDRLREERQAVLAAIEEARRDEDRSDDLRALAAAEQRQSDADDVEPPPAGDDA